MAAATQISIACGWRKSSLSTNMRNSPETSSRASLRAWETPPLLLCIILNLGSDSAYPSSMAALPSLLPSSTHIASQSLKLWAFRLSRQRAMKFSALYTGMMTETVAIFFCVLFHPKIASLFQKASSGAYYFLLILCFSFSTAKLGSISVAVSSVFSSSPNRSAMIFPISVSARFSKSAGPFPPLSGTGRNTGRPP